MGRAAALCATASAVLALALGAPASACCERAHLIPEGKLPGQVPLAIGDSVMLGAAPQLAKAGFEVDAKQGRWMHAALSIATRRLRVQTLPDVVAVALGTNIPPSPQELGDLIRLLGRDRLLILVTPFRGWRPFGAAAMWRAKRLHPSTVRIVDWALLGGANPGWFWGDGTHLRPQGAVAFTRLLRAAAKPHTVRSGRSDGSRGTRWGGARPLSCC